MHIFTIKIWLIIFTLFCVNQPTNRIWIIKFTKRKLCLGDSDKTNYNKIKIFRIWCTVKLVTPLVASKFSVGAFYAYRFFHKFAVSFCSSKKCHGVPLGLKTYSGVLIVQIDWPARSPDMFPVEHVWDTLGQRSRRHSPPPKLSRLWQQHFRKNEDKSHNSRLQDFSEVCDVGARPLSLQTGNIQDIKGDFGYKKKLLLWQIFTRFFVPWWFFAFFEQEKILNFE